MTESRMSSIRLDRVQAKTIEIEKLKRVFFSKEPQKDKYIDVNQEFKNKLSLLYEEKGIKQPAIAEKTGIPLWKIKAIRINRSSAKAEHLNALEKAYPEIFKAEPAPTISTDNHALMTEIGLLKERMAILEGNNNVLTKRLNHLEMSKSKEVEGYKARVEELQKSNEALEEKIRKVLRDKGLDD